MPVQSHLLCRDGIPKVIRGFADDCFLDANKKSTNATLASTRLRSSMYEGMSLSETWLWEWDKGVSWFNVMITCDAYTHKQCEDICQMFSLLPKPIAFRSYSDIFGPQHPFLPFKTLFPCFVTWIFDSYREKMISVNIPTKATSGKSREKKSLSTNTRFLVLVAGALLWRANFEVRKWP